MEEWKKYRLLIVEDDETLSAMYKLKFEKEWFDVNIAENGLEATTLINEFKPDVILLDIMMPDMDWFETLAVIRNQTSLDTKIVMFTNLDKQKDIDEAKQLWADDFIIKANVTPKETVQRVLNLLSQDKRKIQCPHCGKIFNI